MDITVLTQAVTGGTVSGVMIAMILRLWWRGQWKRVEDLEAKVGEMDTRLDTVISDVTRIGYKLPEIDKLQGSVTALHRRLDDHANQESKEKADLAREIGGWTATVQALQSSVAEIRAEVKGLPSQIAGLLRV